MQFHKNSRIDSKLAHFIRSTQHPVLNSLSSISIRAKIKIYKIYIRSVLIYTAPAWGALLSEFNWWKIKAVQYIALHAIANTPWFIHNATMDHSASVSMTMIRTFIQTKSKVILYETALSDLRTPASGHWKNRPINLITLLILEVSQLSIFYRWLAVDTIFVFRHYEGHLIFTVKQTFSIGHPSKDYWSTSELIPSGADSRVLQVTDL